VYGVYGVCVWCVSVCGVLAFVRLGSSKEDAEGEPSRRRRGKSPAPPAAPVLPQSVIAVRIYVWFGFFFLREVLTDVRPLGSSNGSDMFSD